MKMESVQFKKRANRANNMQVEALVEEVYRDQTLHTDKFVGAEGKMSQRLKWEKVAARLNNLGPSKKWDQWKQVWRDFNGKIRKSYLDRLRAAEAINNRATPPVLSELEEKVMTIIGTNITVKIENVDEIGKAEGTTRRIPPSPLPANSTPVPPIMDETNASLMALADALRELESVADAIRGLGDLSGAINNLAAAVRSFKKK